MKNTTTAQSVKMLSTQARVKNVKKLFACPIKMPERKEQLVDIQTPPKNDKENKKHN